jgi:hypothetical protein
MGSPFRIYCSTFAGEKPLFFQFTKNGQTLSNNPEANYKIESSEDLQVSVFSIKSVERSDSGNYSCISRNAFGSDSQTVQLLVRGLNLIVNNSILT